MNSSYIGVFVGVVLGVILLTILILTGLASGAETYWTTVDTIEMVEDIDSSPIIRVEEAVEINGVHLVRYKVEGTLWWWQDDHDRELEKLGLPTRYK